MNFFSGQLVNCRRFRALNIDDDHSKFYAGQIVDMWIPTARLAEFLNDFGLRAGLPEEIILDNGSEGTSKPIFDWSERTGVRLRFIEPGKSLSAMLRIGCQGMGAKRVCRMLQRQVPR
jgi:putative transposase